jgi:molybdopterin-guanine dinucleotide biosynthesis protein
MTLLIDTEAKTVTLMGDVLLCDLYWFLTDGFKDVPDWTIVIGFKSEDGYRIIVVRDGYEEITHEKR